MQSFYLADKESEGHLFRWTKFHGTMRVPSLKWLNARTFENCPNMNALEAGRNGTLEYVGSAAIADCPSLGYLVLGGAATEWAVAAKAFNTANLANVTLVTTAPTYGEDATLVFGTDATPARQIAFHIPPRGTRVTLTAKPDTEKGRFVWWRGTVDEAEETQPSITVTGENDLDLTAQFAHDWTLTPADPDVGLAAGAIAYISNHVWKIIRVTLDDIDQRTLSYGTKAGNQGSAWTNFYNPSDGNGPTNLIFECADVTGAFGADQLYGFSLSAGRLRLPNLTGVPFGGVSLKKGVDVSDWRLDAVTDLKGVFSDQWGAHYGMFRDGRYAGTLHLPALAVVPEDGCYNSFNLEAVELGSNTVVTTIGARAFKGCSSLGRAPLGAGDDNHVAAHTFRWPQTHSRGRRI